MRRNARSALFAMLLLLLLPLTAPPARAADEAQKITYFYENVCASCTPENDFFDLFHQQVGDLTGSVDYHLIPYNTFVQGEDFFLEECARLGVEEKRRSPPMLVLGDRALLGEDAIARDMRAAFCAAFGLEDTGAPPAGADEAPSGTPDAGAPDASASSGGTPIPRKPYFLYFYTASCTDCRKAAAVLDELAAQNPEAVIERRSLVQSDGALSIQSLFERFGVPPEKRQVPILFFEGGYLSGINAIEADAARLLTSPRALYAGFAGGDAAQAPPLTPAQLPMIALAGLLGGLNPCGISMLLLFVSVLALEKKHVLSLGLTYIAVKGAVYFAISFGLYWVMSLLESRLFGGLSRAVQIGAAVLMLCIAGLSLWDFFACRREAYGKVRLQLPAGIRRFCTGVIERLRRPGARKYLYLCVAAVSAVVAAGEFLCTGQVALATLLYMVQASGTVDPMSALALAVYVLAMLAPLTALVLLIWRGQRVFNVSELVRARMPLIKLLGAAAFTLFAVIMLILL